MIPRRWLLPVAAAVAVAQIGFLVSMIAGRASILRTGQEVLLDVRPIDPRDLLRGDYVILNYNISLLPTDLVTNDSETEFTRGRDAMQPIFVRLRADDDGIWQPVSARFDEPPQTARVDGEVDIRGTVRTWRAPDADTISVTYGIERFYVPEGEGREIERDMTARPFRMKVAVAADGSAQIKAFYDGETMLYAEPLY